MTSQERERETEAVSLPRLDTVLHLGAGLCSELDTYLGRGARRILLVEADPQVAEGLERRVAGLSHAEVLSAAVAARSVNSVLHRYSVPGFAALHPATGLKALFPGLREIEGQPVRTLSAEELISPLALDGREGNLLVLETAGEEFPILEALEQSGLLRGFSEIRVRCGRQPLYEGGEPAERILAWLGRRGFDLVAEDATEDPDWPWWSFRCNPLQARIQELEALADRLEDERGGLESSVDALRAQLAQEQRETRIWRESAEAAEVLHQQEVQQINARHEEQARLLLERESQCERLAGEQVALLKQSTQGKAAIDDLQAQLIEQQRQTTVWHDEVKTLRAELEERQTRIERLVEEGSRQQDDWESKLKELSQARERAAVLSTIAEQRAAALVSRANARAEELERRLEESERRVARMTKEQEARASTAEDAEAQLLEQRRHTEYWISECKKLQGEAEQLKSELAGREKEVELELKRRDELEARLSEKDRRQHLIDGELIKAEAQIDLIKDILIREKAF